MERVQVVQLGLKLKSKLDLSLVVVGEERHVLLQFVEHDHLVVELLLEHVVFFDKGVDFDLSFPIVVIEFLVALAQFLLHTLELVLVLSCYLGYEHLVVLAAAVLEEDSKDSPDCTLEQVFVLEVTQRLSQHLIKSY